MRPLSTYLLGTATGRAESAPLQPRRAGLGARLAEGFQATETPRDSPVVGSTYDTSRSPSKLALSPDLPRSVSVAPRATTLGAAHQRLRRQDLWPSSSPPAAVRPALGSAGERRPDSRIVGPFTVHGILPVGTGWDAETPTLLTQSAQCRLLIQHGGRTNHREPERPLSASSPSTAIIFPEGLIACCVLEHHV